MEWQQLKYFCTVARLEHMSRASEELNISQPSLSLSIRRLESELGVSLFDRNGRNIKLNSCGKAFLARVTPALELLELGRQEVNEIKATKNNQLTIVSPSLFIFPGLMDKVLAYNPNISIKHTNLYSPFKVAQMLLNHEINFCLTCSPLPGDGLSSENLRPDPVVMILTENHPLALQKTIRLGECRDQQFATFNTNNLQRYNFDRLCSEADLVPQISFEGNTMREIIGAVKGSRYIALVARQGLDLYDIKDLALVEVEDVPKDIYLKMYWSKANETPVARSVRHIITEYFNSSEKAE